MHVRTPPIFVEPIRPDASSTAIGTVRLARDRACGTVLGMSTPSNPYRCFRYPPEIINQAVWLYHCFSLSLREVELIFAARGIAVSYETIREWSLRFGRTYAKTLKRILRKLLKRQGIAPRVLVTDKLASYAAAKRDRDAQCGASTA